ncbi:MAG: phosphoribosylformylglycinamidine synthase subunit PurS [Chitinophagales bacterium]|nr:phosphoribosylformylglycinamidine synthase subunit PurS [Chitinophagales bacterium]MDW8427767.1 phosphoribosylformylglycinamidine synthase subunit PurS [Chitinophagales bacterium]
MVFLAEIDVMPHPELLDPQGKATLQGLRQLGVAAARDVRIGKHIRLELEADSAEQARELAEEACRKLLVNPVMERFEIRIHA